MKCVTYQGDTGARVLQKSVDHVHRTPRLRDQYGQKSRCRLGCQALGFDAYTRFALDSGRSRQRKNHV